MFTIPGQRQRIVAIVRGSTAGLGFLETENQDEAVNDN